MDPLPMQGPELGVQADDMDLGEPDREEKQEVLENKDVRFLWLLSLMILRKCGFVFESVLLFSYAFPLFRS